MELKICHLYPDVLNLYGDRGNITCFTQRLAWRGIDSTVIDLPVGQMTDFDDVDIFFIGGGQDFEQGVLLDDLNDGKADALCKAIEDGKVVLAICGGYQMLGHYYLTHDGERCNFIGAIDFYTVGQNTRMIGNYMFECLPESGGSTIVAFENHSGKTFLGKGVSPLGKIKVGHGNNGEDCTEGVRYKNVFGTYGHGPLLPKNPQFADFLLQIALQRKYPSAELVPLDDTLEYNAHNYMEAHLSKQQSN